MVKHESKDAGDLEKRRSQVTSSVSTGKPSSTAAQGNLGDTAAKSGGATELPPQFGRYRVIKKLGGGGMGTVYLVENTELEREEALKVPHFSDGDDPQVRERFLREAKSAAKLDHANLCPVYDAGVQDGIYYLTMRFLKGRPLSDYVGKPQPDRKAAEIVAKLALALEAAHAKGVIHRDLKPGNVMMVSGSGPVVMDFGLAKQVRQTDQKLTQDGSMLGTPAYMPPEQLQGELDQLGPASDVYSLGVMLYELLTGRLPFDGTMAMICGQILYTEPPLPSALVPAVSPTLDGICRKAMAKAPAERYPSMRAFAAALMDYLRGAPATESGYSLQPSTVDKPAALQPASIAPGRQPAGNSDLFQAATLPPLAGPSRPSSRATQTPSLTRPKTPTTGDGGASKRHTGLVVGVALGVLVIAIGLWALVFRVRTSEGTLVVQVNEPDADLYVDGERVTVTWQNSGLKAEVGVTPGARKVELKKNGFRAYGQEVLLEDGGRTMLLAKLEPTQPDTQAVPVPSVDAPQRETGKSAADTAGTTAVAPSDPFQVKSVWVDNNPRNVLTVTERKGDKFTAKFEIDNREIEREVTGTINDGKVSWLAKDVRAIRGGAGGDNEGTIGKDASGDKIDFVWRQNGVSGAFTLRLSTSPAQQTPPGPSQSQGNVFADVMRRAPGRSTQIQSSEIQKADIDRGRSLRASTEPAEIAKIVGEVAPGFTAKLPVIPGGVSIVAEHFGRSGVLCTHPLDPNRPCTLTMGLNVPADKKTLLTFDVSHSPVGDWEVIVLANGERLYDETVGPATAKDGWLAVSVDLTPFAGKLVILELQNKATGYSHEWGYWDRVKITSGDGDSVPQTLTVAGGASPEASPAEPVPEPPTVTSIKGSAAGDLRDDNVLKMKFCWCPAGKTRGFWMGKYEVTQSEWLRLMGSMPSLPMNKGKGDRFPIYNVSLDEAEAFCRELTSRERKAGRLPREWAYRVPSEEDWEYACRAGTTTATAFGDGLSSTQANFNGDFPHNGAPKGPNLQQAVEVGSYPPNAWGICDMHGNVKEFTTTPGHVRGGSWYDSGRNCCSEIFIPDPPGALESLGFRVARVPSLELKRMDERPKMPQTPKPRSRRR